MSVFSVFQPFFSKSHLLVLRGGKELGKLLTKLENQMLDHARNLEFEEAAQVRDQLQEIRQAKLFS